MHRWVLLLLAAALLLPLAHPAMGGGEGSYNGLSSWAPANGYDAPIFRQFAFADGRAAQMHVLNPWVFRIDAHVSPIYQFPACETLRPVLGQHLPTPDDGGFQGAHDAPIRQVVDVALATGCAVQPRSEAEVRSLALHTLERPFYVNAPRIPAALAALPDEVLFNGPPFRPRIAAYHEGAEAPFITYEASWYPTWAATAFPGVADAFLLNLEPVFRQGHTLLNLRGGAPLDWSMESYAPVGEAICMVDPDVPRCGGLDMADGWDQCWTVAECLTMESSVTGKRVVLIKPDDFTHIDWPIVAVDLSGDDHLDPFEEIPFPTLWQAGPVLV